MTIPTSGLPLTMPTRRSSLPTSLNQVNTPVPVEESAYDWDDEVEIRPISEHIGEEQQNINHNSVPDAKTPKYLNIGDINAELLFDPKENKYELLKDAIEAYTTLIHDRIKDEHKTDQVTAARNGDDHAKTEIRNFIDQEMLKSLNRESNTSQTDQKFIVRTENRRFLVGAVINEIIGLGPLEPLLNNSEITEIMANGPYDIQVEIKGALHRVPGVSFRDQEHLLSLCQKILSFSSRRVDLSQPITDGRLPDNSRVHVVHQYIAPAGPNLTIRRHRDEKWTVKEMIERGSFTEDMAVDLAWLIHSGCSTIIVGGTGTGKTTMLNALSGLFPTDARIVTIEDNLELQIDKSRLAAAPMETKDAAASGGGAITIRDLVKASLRMRPDRIIVGEVRDSAAMDMLTAMNTGHAGSMTTIHANGADEAIPRLESMVGQSGETDARGSLALIAGAIDLLIIIERFPEDGSRRMTGIYEVPNRIDADNNELSLTPIPLWEYIHTSTDPVTNEVIGHWEKKNEISEATRRKHRLDRQVKMTIDQVYDFSS